MSVRQDNRQPETWHCSRVASIGKQVGLVRVDKSVAYLDIDATGLAEAGYGPQV